MLDRNEINQVHDAALWAMAEVYRAINTPHGSFTHLCVVADGSPIWAHHPVGRVIYASP